MVHKKAFCWSDLPDFTWFHIWAVFLGVSGVTGKAFSGVSLFSDMQSPEGGHFYVIIAFSVLDISLRYIII